MTTVTRNEKGQIVKGSKSLNPGGRDKLPAEVRARLLYVTPEAVQTIIEIMRDKRVSAKVRLTAAQEILNRVYGRPVQAHDLSGGGDQIIKIIMDDGAPK